MIRIPDLFLASPQALFSPTSVKSLEGCTSANDMGDAVNGPLSDTPVPSEPPQVPEDVVDAVLTTLSGHVEAVFLPWIADRFTLEWLSVDDDRLGMTRFEEGSAELIRRRRLRLRSADRCPARGIICC